MVYNEKKAGELKEKYNIPDATLITWRRRNKIPDKYFKDDFEVKKPLSRTQANEWEKIVNILNSGKINKTFLTEKAGVSNDVIRGKVMPGASDVLSLKKQINEIRINVKAILIAIEREKTNLTTTTKKKLYNLIKNREIYTHVVFDRDEAVRTAVDWFMKTGGETLRTDAIMKMKTGLLIFLTETTI